MAKGWREGMKAVRGVFLMLFTLLAAGFFASAATAYEPARPETVVVRSGSLRLHAVVWHPTGAGPFPGVLFNHGSGHKSVAPVAGGADHRHPELLGPVFARHGYVFLYLFRRGDGLSADQGTPCGDRMDEAFKSGGQEARNRVQMHLLLTDEMDDALAGLAYLRARHDVDPRRIAAVGHSFGATLTLLLAERDSTLRAAVAFSSGGYSWDRSPAFRARLIAAADRIRVPLFLIQAANDFSTGPARGLGQELARRHKVHRTRIYPPVGHTPEDGHDFVHSGIATWEGDVFSFLRDSMRGNRHGA
jgi:dienelactone hydrolase